MFSTTANTPETETSDVERHCQEFLNHNEPDSAIKIAKAQKSGSYEKINCFVEIFDYFILKARLAEAIEIISDIDSIHYKDQCYSKLFNYYFGYNDIQESFVFAQK